MGLPAAVAMTVLSQLQTDVSLSHRIGATFPKLVVTMKNAGKTPLPLMRFSSDVCFATYLLSVSVTVEATDKEYDEVADCPVLSWPGVAGELAPGVTEQRELDLQQLFPALKPARGWYTVFAGWQPDALKSYGDGGYAVPSGGGARSGMPFAIAKPLGKVRAAAKKWVTLSDGARFRFDSHGHKETMPGGPESPLIIHGVFAPPGKKEQEVDAYVYFNEGRSFALGDAWYTFELGEYRYGDFMELTYYGSMPRK